MKWRIDKMNVFIIVLASSFLCLSSCHRDISKSSNTVESQKHFHNATKMFKNIPASEYEYDYDSVVVGIKSTCVGDVMNNTDYVGPHPCTKLITSESKNRQKDQSSNKVDFKKPKRKKSSNGISSHHETNFIQFDYGNPYNINTENETTACIGSHACRQTTPPEAEAYWISPNKILILIPKFYGLHVGSAIIENPNLKNMIISYNCTGENDCVFFDGPNTALPSISYKIHNRRPLR